MEMGKAERKEAHANRKVNSNDVVAEDTTNSGGDWSELRRFSRNLSPNSRSDCS